MSEADDLARRVAEALILREGTAPAFGITLDEARAGYARIRMTVRADMLNGHRTIHGGMIFTLADTAFAYACNARNVSTVAQQASILFLAPAMEDDILIAEAEENFTAGRTGAYTVLVRTEDGRPIAQFQGLSRSVGGPVVTE